LFITWLGRFSFGVSISILSALAWGWADLASGHHYSNSIIPIWNTVMRLIIFVTIVYFTSKLKKALSVEKELSQRKSDFVSNVSHEFKNPLIIIRSSLDLILAETVGGITSEQRRLLNMGKNSVERLLRLVSDLLDLSKIEAGRMNMKRENFDISLLVNEILSMFEKEFSNKNILLSKNIPSGIGMIWADRDKISEVIINIISNAVKYTLGGGKVGVKLIPEENELYFEISDSGIGIAEEHKDKIFDKFERINSEKVEGTGLGLPIAKDIIELHKGRIWVESKLGQGSRFIFVLPKDLRKKN
jgi:signal transduction histidine kinase